MSTREGATFFAFKDGTAPRDVHAHLFTRADFLSRLVDDPQVLHLFHTFEGLWHIAGVQAQLADVFARECGWRDRTHMYAEPELHDETQNPHCDAFIASGAAFPWNRLSTFRAAAEHLVHETWRLPRHHQREQWAWLSADLMRLFVLALEGALLGRTTMLFFSSQGSTPSIEVSFSTRTGESPGEARRRLKQLYEESDAALGPAAPTRHDGAIVDEERLRRDDSWFYDRDIKRPAESLRSLARKYDQAAHPSADQKGSRDHRPTVRAGIARARRLLSEIPS